LAYAQALNGDVQHARSSHEEAPGARPGLPDGPPGQTVIRAGFSAPAPYSTGAVP
jgi:hypothetical protein